MPTTVEHSRDELLAAYTRIAAIEYFLENTIANPDEGPAPIFLLPGHSLAEQITVFDHDLGMEAGELWNATITSLDDPPADFIEADRKAREIAARMLLGTPTWDVLRERADRLLSPQTWGSRS